jgi:hypothetical protein
MGEIMNINKSNKRDLFMLAGLLGFVTIYFVALYLYEVYGKTIFPYEDAVMIIRYAQNIAGGHGIVWNIGGPAVDGCTDFLLTIVLAVLIKLKLSGEFAVRLLGIVSHTLTIGFIYLTIRKTLKLDFWYAAISSIYLAIGPALLYIAFYWGTPFFALFAAISWYFAIKIAINDEQANLPFYFGFSCLIMGLIRPEGVF